MKDESARYFQLEARELTGQLEAGLLAYEKRPEALLELFRFAHTLKGGARVVNHHAIVDLAHAMEDVFAHHREAGTHLTKQELMELLSLVDAVRSELNGESAGALGIASPEHAAPSPRDLATVRVDLSDMDVLAGGIHEAESLATGLRLELRTQGELQEAGISAELAQRMAEKARRLTTLADSLELALRRLGRKMNVLRLFDASLAFAELERATYDAAALTGKSVSFTARGGGVKLDGHVLSPLRGALQHLVRNAVAHGIEHGAVRTERGKSATGRVQLLVERRGARIAFVVKDDGAGIDLAAVRQAAAQRGLAVNGADGMDMIFQPGVSTANGVSALAGRGVGLDAVRAVVRKLKGTIEVRSELGSGSTFEIVVPVSLSAMRALVVGIGSQRVLVPLDRVVSTVRLSQTNSAVRSDGRVLLHDDAALPLHDLHSWLDPRAERNEPRIAVVLETSQGRAAFVADALAGTRDITVRSLPYCAGDSALVLGAAFDAQGDPELVLDPDAISASSRRAMQVDAVTLVKPRRILVVDDSLTTRMLEQSILEGAGYEVDLASCAHEALEKAMQNEYGLIVTDIEMPGMNGYDFTVEIRRRPKLRAIPVIMVSSLGSEESRKRGADVGSSAYIVKGEFDQDGFLRVVREWLG
ncbi:MAG: hybrid sensor histidine kinase/response regulator [Myxococcota bacterium]